ncbi:MAG: D-lyxose/D-mannose family sugar isomerase [Promethearchaeota archaeon]|nr:MAG: D-lyxose/D-mannose family sugar isomerase [Candidatus Lokiarchaeota archaeon]
MKRSRINKLIEDAIDFLKDKNFYLPQFAFWDLKQWLNKRIEIKEIIYNQLGWDLTDFGRGNFSTCGLLLFTIRNGNMETIKDGGKNYCEKIMVVQESQITPMHHHFQKIEDIINRSGGRLMIQIYGVRDNNKLSNKHINVTMDGIKYTIEAGTIIELEPGDSITLTPNIYHKFWGKEGEGPVLVGEISSVNDDLIDNYFLENTSRFPEVEEDITPKYLLYEDYGKFLDLSIFSTEN